MFCLQISFDKGPRGSARMDAGQNLLYTRSTLPHLIKILFEKKHVGGVFSLLEFRISEELTRYYHNDVSNKATVCIFCRSCLTLSLRLASIEDYL